MSILLKFSLIIHILFGFFGIALFFAVWRSCINKIDAKRIKFLRKASFWGLIGFILSWISGGYYYVLHYGSQVKPLIKAGKYPWAHSVIMETKEHIFLFLPFVAVVVALLFYLLGEDIENKPKIKKVVIWFSAIIVFIGVAITLMGKIISEAAEKY